MTTTCPKNREKGNVALIVLVLLVVAGVAAYVVISKQQGGAITALPTLPPASERTNPAPTSGYAVAVTKVDPGNKLTVDSVDLSADGYLVVTKEGKTETVIGKSSLLTAGNHTNVVINLTSKVSDGDVVWVKLQDTKGVVVQNEYKQNIEVQKNVGNLMIHYANEY